MPQSLRLDPDGGLGETDVAAATLTLLQADAQPRVAAVAGDTVHLGKLSDVAPGAFGERTGSTWIREGGEFEAGWNAQVGAGVGGGRGAAVADGEGEVDQLPGWQGLRRAINRERNVAETSPAAAGLVTVTMQGKGLSSGTTSIASLDLKGTVKDPLNTATTDATLTVGGMKGAGDINRVTATANGNRQGLVVALQATGSRTDASMRGKVEPDGNDILVSLSRFEGRHSGIPVALTAPTRLRIAGSRISLDPTNFRLGGGRLSARRLFAGRRGPALR